MNATRAIRVFGRDAEELRRNTNAGAGRDGRNRGNAIVTPHSGQTSAFNISSRLDRYLDDVSPVSDGRKSFVYQPGRWAAMRYEGDYLGGLRDGVWRVTDAETASPKWETTWSSGEWHGSARAWYSNGQLEHEGEHSHGQRAGEWTFWFPSGQLAAHGRYAHDQKVGVWDYWNEHGGPMSYEAWEGEYHEYDWAYDDYSGFPRGENWPSPPDES